MKGNYDKDIKALSEQIMELWNISNKQSARIKLLEMKQKEMEK